MPDQKLSLSVEFTYKELHQIVNALEMQAEFNKKRRQECKLLGLNPESINYWNDEYKLCNDIINRLNTLI